MEAAPTGLDAVAGVTDDPPTQVENLTGATTYEPHRVVGRDIGQTIDDHSSNIDHSVGGQSSNDHRQVTHFHGDGFLNGDEESDLKIETLNTHLADDNDGCGLGSAPNSTGTIANCDGGHFNPALTEGNTDFASSCGHFARRAGPLDPPQQGADEGFPSTQADKQSDSNQLSAPTDTDTGGRDTGLKYDDLTLLEDCIHTCEQSEKKGDDLGRHRGRQSEAAGDIESCRKHNKADESRLKDVGQERPSEPTAGCAVLKDTRKQDCERGDDGLKPSQTGVLREKRVSWNLADLASTSKDVSVSGCGKDSGVEADNADDCNTNNNASADEADCISVENTSGIDASESGSNLAGIDAARSDDRGLSNTQKEEYDPLDIHQYKFDLLQPVSAIKQSNSADSAWEQQGGGDSKRETLSEEASCGDCCSQSSTNKSTAYDSTNLGHTNAAYSCDNDFPMLNAVLDALDENEVKRNSFNSRKNLDRIEPKMHPQCDIIVTDPDGHVEYQKLRANGSSEHRSFLHASNGLNGSLSNGKDVTSQNGADVRFRGVKIQLESDKEEKEDAADDVFEVTTGDNGRLKIVRIPRPDSEPVNKPRYSRRATIMNFLHSIIPGGSGSSPRGSPAGSPRLSRRAVSSSQLDSEQLTAPPPPLGGRQGRDKLSTRRPGEADEGEAAALVRKRAFFGRSAAADRRLVNAAGHCNIESAGIEQEKYRYLKDLFTTLVDLHWALILLLFSFVFLFTWLVFAVIWWIIGYAHGDFDEANLASDAWRPCVDEVYDFTTCFLFSLETQHTIGYGSRATTPHCAEAILIMMVQSCMGVIMQALVTGLVLCKLMRPKLRAETLLFSRHAVMHTRNGHRRIQLRVADMRKSHIIEAHVRLVLVTRLATREGELLPLRQYELKVGEIEGDNQVFMNWPVTLEHRVDERSPFWGLGRDDLARWDYELVVVLEGIVESTGMCTQALKSYKHQDILFDHELETCIALAQSGKKKGKFVIDYKKFHNCVPLTGDKEIIEEDTVSDTAEEDTAEHNNNLSCSGDTKSNMAATECDNLGSRSTNNVHMDSLSVHSGIVFQVGNDREYT